ncbi:MAG: DUF4411 family protein [Gammaproteobacteria bacterium]|nr:DUF4411 family protein [Gammaproteobacteria bacterium]
MKLHLIDTDVFIRANREHYGLDYCPAFWDWLGFPGQAGNVESVVAVLEEIQYPTELKQWARGPGRQLFRGVDTDVMAAATEVSRWVHGEGYAVSADGVRDSNALDGLRNRAVSARAPCPATRRRSWRGSSSQRSATAFRTMEGVLTR